MKKFCILSAGKGTRNSNIVGLHKALLPLENKPVISHIIDKLDKNIEIVITLGYKSDQVKSYVNLLHSDRNITFVEVDNFDGVGSGPGYSLLCCKDELQEPFVFTSVDTLVYRHNLAFPNLIKIDVDGNEHKILSGMSKILKDQRLKSIAIETDDRIDARQLPKIGGGQS